MAGVICLLSKAAGWHVASLHLSVSVLSRSSVKIMAEKL